MWRRWFLTSQQVMGPACAVCLTDVAHSNPAACSRVSGPGWKLQVGNFESIEEWFLVAVQLGGVLNGIQQLHRTSHTGLVALLVFRPQQVMGLARAGFSFERSRVRDSPRPRPRRGTEEFAGEAFPSRGSDEPGPEELGGVLNW